MNDKPERKNHFPISSKIKKKKGLPKFSYSRKKTFEGG